MSCKSALYAVNTNAQTLSVGNTINFGSIVRRYGCNCRLDNGNAVTIGSGYYDVDANINLEGGTAGTVTITLYKDGVVIPGASATLSVEATTAYSLNISALVRNVCNCESTITAVISGVGAIVNTASIIVEKV